MHGVSGLKSVQHPQGFGVIAFVVADADVRVGQAMFDRVDAVRQKAAAVVGGDDHLKWYQGVGHQNPSALRTRLIHSSNSLRRRRIRHRFSGS